MLQDLPYSYVGNDRRFKFCSTVRPGTASPNESRFKDTTDPFSAPTLETQNKIPVTFSGRWPYDEREFICSSDPCGQAVLDRCSNFAPPELCSNIKNVYRFRNSSKRWVPGSLYPHSRHYYPRKTHFPSTFRAAFYCSVSGCFSLWWACHRLEYLGKQLAITTAQWCD